MRFSTVFSVLAFGVMALAAAVAPDVLVSRSNADISSTISALDKKCDAILPQFGWFTFSFERSSSADAQGYIEGSCMDPNCTQTLVLEIVAAVDVATAACLNLKGISNSILAKEIADVVIVSASRRPNLM